MFRSCQILYSIMGLFLALQEQASSDEPLFMRIAVLSTNFGHRCILDIWKWDILFGQQDLLSSVQELEIGIDR